MTSRFGIMWKNSHRYFDTKSSITRKEHLYVSKSYGDECSDITKELFATIGDNIGNANMNSWHVTESLSLSHDEQLTDKYAEEQCVQM